MIKIKQFHFPSMEITLHNITGICEARWTNGQFTHLGLHHGQDHLFEASEVNEDTEREFKRLKLVLQVAHGEAKAQVGGVVFDTYKYETNSLVNSEGAEWRVDNFGCPIERYKEPQWVTIRTLEEALPWLGATVEIKYEQSKSALKIGISGICGHPKGRVSVQTEGHGYVTHTRDPHPIQVRGKRHPNSTEIMCKWRELDALVRG